MQPASLPTLILGGCPGDEMECERELRVESQLKALRVIAGTKGEKEKGRGVRNRGMMYSSLSGWCSV